MKRLLLAALMLVAVPAGAESVDIYAGTGNTSSGAVITKPIGTCTGCTSLPTSAASPLAAARHFPGCTVGTASTDCLAAGTAVGFLQVENTSTAATIACAFGTTPTLNSSTAIQLAVGQSASWGPSTLGVPSGQLNCIASTASTPLYVEWN